jgi:hypothetical protein
MVAVPEPSKGESRFSVYLVSDRVQRLTEPMELLQANGWSKSDLVIAKARDRTTLPREPRSAAPVQGKTTVRRLAA